MTQQKTKVVYKGTLPVEIQAGEFRGYFEPNKEYRINDRRFALHLLEQEDDFELVPAHTHASLSAHKKDFVVEMAVGLGIPDAENMNKEPLIEAILKQEESLNV